MKTIKTILAALAVLALVPNMASAQKTETKTERVIKLKMEKDVNGKVISIDTTLTVDENFDVQAFLKSKGFDEAPMPGMSKTEKKIVLINDDMVGFPDSAFDDLDSEMIVWTENIMQNEDGTDVIQYKGISPDGKRMMVKEVKIKIVDLDDSERKNIAPTLGTKELTVEGLTFYPNPNGGKFNLKFSLQDGKKTNVRIMDLTGKVVYEESVPAFNGSYDKQIDISESGKGVYIIQVSQGDKSTLKKIVIQ